MTMFNANRGYVGYSMSVRAQEAYEDGEKPLSKWTKADILQEIEYILSESDEAQLTLDDFKKLRLNELKKAVLLRTSWHHTSSRFNRTDFYSVDEYAVEDMTREDLDRILSNGQKKKPVEQEKRIKAKYLVWGGSRRRPKATEHVEEGTIKGNWFYSDSGIKKSINANGFEVIEVIK